jgi:hypothetical protein
MWHLFIMCPISVIQCENWMGRGRSKRKNRVGNALTFYYYYYKINKKLFGCSKYYILYNKNIEVEYIELFLDNVTLFFL